MKANPQGYWAPDYEGQGLLNLMVSIADVCGAEASPYPPLAGVATAGWGQARNLVLILADGVGADFIARHSPHGFLRRHQVATLSSVCPSTTAVAVPTFMSGLPPTAHGITGWHVYLEEIDSVTAVLPLTVRGIQLASGSVIDPELLFPYPTLYSRLPRPSHVVSPVKIADSPFSRVHSRGATLHPYFPEAGTWLNTVPFCRRKKDFFGTLRRLCHEPGPARFVHAYWPDFDHAAHEAGVDSASAVALFHQFEAGLEAFLASVRGTDTQVIVTADHGFIDSPSDRQVHLADHVAFGDLLTQPICGERRFAYCYLKPGTHADFEDYVDTVFAGRMSAWPREKLLAEQWFGPGPVNDRLARRVGDYVLAMQENWTMVDHVPGERPIQMIGVHGGLSRSEMLVPLCSASS